MRQLSAACGSTPHGKLEHYEMEINRAMLGIQISLLKSRNGTTARILSLYEYMNYLLLLVVQVFVRPPSLARTFSYCKDRFFPSPAKVTLATVTAYPPPRKSHEEHHPLAMRRAHWRHHLVEGIRGLLRAIALL